MSEILILEILRKTAGCIRTPVVLCVLPKGKKQQVNPCGKEKAMNITEITSVRQQTAERLRLAPYCRVSSDSDDQRHSFAAQIRYYSDYAKRHPEYELADIYALREPR